MAKWRTVPLSEPVYEKVRAYKKEKGYPNIAQTLAAIITEFLAGVSKA